VIVVTGSPEIADVAGAVSCCIEVSDCPAGMAFSTKFFNAAGEMIRQDQHIDAFRMFDAANGTASLYRPPTLQPA
jgi:hypothetical protein